MGFSQEQLEDIKSLAKSSAPVTVKTKEKKSELRKVGERTLGGALKVIDFIERPYHALMNVGVDFYGGEEGFSPIKAVGRGLAGKEKSDFDDILTEAGWQPQTTMGKITKAGVSFVGGVALDPITYLTFGTGKGIQIGGKIITKRAEKEFLEVVSKKLGKKIVDKKGLSKLSGGDLKKYNKVAEIFKKEKVWKNPDAYWNKTALKFAGREVPIATDAVKGVQRNFSKVMKPIMNTQFTRYSERTGKAVTKSLGEIFDPTYGIKNSRNLTDAKKFELLEKLELNRSTKAWNEMKTIEETRRMFKKMSPKKREQVTFEIEKFLKLNQKEKTSTVINRVVKEAKNKKVSESVVAGLMHGDVTPFTLIEQEKYVEALLAARWVKRMGKTDFDKRTVKLVMDDIKMRISQKTANAQNVESLLGDIKDAKVKQVVEIFQNRMKQVWDEEIALGARKKADPINVGYVKRIMKKGDRPEDYSGGFFNKRKTGVLSIEETKKAFKKGDVPYMFESDAAKVYAARMTQSNAIIMRKQLVDWMEEKMPEAFKKAGKIQTEGMTQVKLWGKHYETVPEIARELKKIAPQLNDVGMQKFLKSYDKIQNTWKLSVTSFWPSFHSRNAVSNVYLGWLGGNKSPQTYKDAFRLQQYGHNVKLGKKVKDEIIEVSGRKFKMSELWEMGGESGVIGTGWFGGEFVNKLAINKSLKDPVDALEFYARFPRRLGTAVENNARIALFIDRLGKGDDVFSASQHVKKFLFDYGHLSETERKLFRRVVPFYSWMRKNIPLQLEQMVKQPGKYTSMLHAQRGVESMSPAEEEKYLPSWMREEELYVRLPGKKYFNPDLPFQDLAKVALSHRTIREIVAPISPLIKGIFEIAANRDLFRDRPLADQRLPASKFAREKIKKELINNMRFNTIYKRATDEDKALLAKFLDVILGISVSPFDVAQGRKFYQKRKTEERSALRKLEQKNK